MIRGSKCPAREVLEQIAGGGRPSFMVRRHLANCSGCKDTLANIADLLQMAGDLREADEAKPDAAQQQRLQALLVKLAPEFNAKHSSQD